MVIRKRYEADMSEVVMEIKRGFLVGAQTGPEEVSLIGRQGPVVYRCQADKFVRRGGGGLARVINLRVMSGQRAGCEKACF